MKSSNLFHGLSVLGFVAAVNGERMLRCNGGTGAGGPCSQNYYCCDPILSANSDAFPTKRLCTTNNGGFCSSPNSAGNPVTGTIACVRQYICIQHGVSAPGNRKLISANTRPVFGCNRPAHRVEIKALAAKAINVQTYRLLMLSVDLSI
ncbi:hypothetical protein BKA61DRAFT_664819 [Leptodontidium sp. MPI-SDFR-AT-0119]|nr:hypothetical protein BKA61DRAFT_664819 [Leptodontidium sp. MPI-SDFR-AT-0119]